MSLSWSGLARVVRCKGHRPHLRHFEMDIRLALMKILGLKLSRYRQWREVLREELRVLTIMGKLRLAMEIFEVVLNKPTGQPVLKVWSRRMRKCYRCPVFDRSLRRCRPYTGSPLGCGCWMPLAAIFKTHGWLTDSGLDKDGLCW